MTVGEYLDRRLVGLVLMGGLNSRMGGEKKALLVYKNKYFYEHVANAMKEAGVERVFASVEKLWDMELGMMQIVDKYDKIGPLGGVTTMLEMLQDAAPDEKQVRNAFEDVQGILVLPCDLPRISANLLKRLLTKFEETKLPVVLMSEGWPNPLVAIYTKDCLPVLKEQIAEGNYRATHWIKLVEHAEVGLCEEDKYMIANINSKEDYAALTE